MSSPLLESRDRLLRYAFGLFCSISVAMMAGHFIYRILKGSGLGPADLEWVQKIVNSTAVQGAAVFWTFWFLRAEKISWTEEFGVSRDTRSILRAVGLGLTLGLLVLPNTLILLRLSQKMMIAMDLVPQLQEPVRALQRIVQQAPAARPSPWLVQGWALLAFTIVPIAEEIVFRGILYRALKCRTARWFALVSSSLIFGLIHFEMAHIVPLAFLGLAFALLYDFTGSLLAPIVAHGLFNFLNYSMLQYGDQVFRFLFR